MKYIITGRNIEVTEGLKSAIYEKIGKLERYFTPDATVYVTLSVQKDRQKIEVTIPVKGSLVRAEQESSDMYVSIDLVEEIIERQLRRYKTKLIAREQDGGDFSSAFIEEEDEFSNEAGMGSTPHAHALAHVKTPHDQGVVAMIGVFVDTFVVLTLNALVIISTLYTEGGPLHECGAAAASTTLGKANLAQTAFGVVFGETAGNMFVAVCLFFFAFSTILGWNLFGKINVAYLFGKKSVLVYTILALVFIFLGTMMANDLVWELSDMFNNLMVIPNVIALFALTNLVTKHSNDPVHDLKKK